MVIRDGSSPSWIRPGCAEASKLSYLPQSYGFEVGRCCLARDELVIGFLPLYHEDGVIGCRGDEEDDGAAGMQQLGRRLGPGAAVEDCRQEMPVDKNGRRPKRGRVLLIAGLPGEALQRHMLSVDDSACGLIVMSNLCYRHSLH